jgi:hypothetical protein
MIRGREKGPNIIERLEFHRTAQNTDLSQTGRIRSQRLALDGKDTVRSVSAMELGRVS